MAPFDEISDVQEELSFVLYCLFSIIFCKSPVCQCHSLHISAYVDRLNWPVLWNADEQMDLRTDDDIQVITTLT